MLFRNILGQSELAGQLISAVKNNRISHAQLFLSPRGSGGLPLAVAYASYLVCQDKQDDDACGNCASCLKISKLAHPDIHFSFPVVLKSREREYSDHCLGAFREAFLEEPYMDINYWNKKLGDENKKGIINVKESEQILKKLNLRTYEGSYKVLIMWMAESLNTSASNKLLKIIEEPPANTVFILVAESQENILPTILSRTQLIKVPPVNEDLIANELQNAYNLPAAEAQSIAAFSEGDYYLAKQRAADGGDTFNLTNFGNWMRMCHSKNISKLTTWIDAISSSGRQKQKNLLQYGLHIYRQCFLYNNGGEEMIKMRGEEKEFIKKFSVFVKNDKISKIYELFNDAFYHIDRNANPKILFLDLSLKIMVLIR